MTHKSKADTVIVHAGLHPHDNHGVPNPPIYRASTILRPTIDAYEHPDDPFPYGRDGTPTTRALEEAITALENAAGTVLTPSGLSAITLTVLAYVDHGGHILITDSVYPPVRKFVTQRLTRMGIDVEFYDPRIGVGIADIIRDDTWLIWMETPGFGTFELPDIPAIVSAAQARGVPTAIDSTWGAGYYLKPLDLGVDVSVQSASKYISGHSDMLMGVIACGEDSLPRIKKERSLLGICVSPDEAYLAQRGLRSMAARLVRHQENGFKIARWFEERPEVKRVLHPGLESHPDHALWKRDFTGACGLFSIVLETSDRKAACAMVDGLKFFGIGASWGGFESLAVFQYPNRTRTVVPWTDDSIVLRFHIGLENPDDLIADLEDGFRRLNASV